MSNPNLGGPAAPEHQCKAKRTDGERCRKYALRGSDYCQFHGGRRSSKKIVPLGDLPVFYGGVLNATLQQVVESELARSPHEQLNLFEELALVRIVARDAVKLYTVAAERGTEETLAAAGIMMRDALNEVVRTCESASRVSANASDKVSVHNIAHVVRQLTRIAAEVMDEEQARKFNALVKTRISIDGGPKGTLSTPDADVHDMDTTIPGGPR